jgi:hypothetical protein
MPTIRIMNWNIQNLGPTKSGLKHSNYDIITAIGQLVVANQVDLLVLLEINTTSAGKAKAVMQMLQAALNHYSEEAGFANGYETGLLSPNTGREFYGFFIRDTNVLRPLPLTGPVAATQYDTLGGAFYPALAAAEFTKVDIPPGRNILDVRFPLLYPDVKLRPASRTVAAWPGPRAPCLGLFEVQGAAPANAYLPVFACHFAAAKNLATQQIRTLRFFSLLRGLAPDPPPSQPAYTPLSLQIRPAPNAPPAAHPMYQVVVTGDFNVDFFRSPKNYNPLAKQEFPSLGCPGYLPLPGSDPKYVPKNTHLVTFSDFSQRVQKATWQLAVSAYDNFFVRGSAANGGAFPPPPAAAGGGNRRVAEVRVSDVPALVMNRTLKLKDSVQHYAELDQRGFDGSTAYLTATQDFANQLAGDKGNYINLQGALIGGRLISDHLPVITDIQLA